MDPTTLLLGLALVFGLYMAWNIGANDVANAMGTSVGSGALTIRQAVMVAAVFEFAGAVLVGGHVTDTIRQGIFDPALFAGEPMNLAVGMLAALLAAGLWLQFASARGLPVSTTHSIVGAVVGFAIAAYGLEAVRWEEMLQIVASWIVSPLVGGVVAFLSFSVVKRTILDAKSPLVATRRVAPVMVFVVGLVLGLVLFFKGLKNLGLDLSLGDTVLLASLLGVAGAAATAFWLRRLRAGAIGRDAELREVEHVFAWIQIVTACFMAFAHGSNDVANAVGPLAAIVSIVREGAVAVKTVVPIWILALGGVGIVLGLATFGARVIVTVGKKITEMTPTRGFAAEFGAALTILVGSRLGLPLSTTHVLVGAVIGVGFARGVSALNVGVIRGVVVSWVVTVPVGAALAAVLYRFLTLVFDTSAAA